MTGTRACIRYLGEDPWERIRTLKAAMPNTPQQMLFRGQNILGYRHYADDLVEKFVERCAVNGVDVFRIFLENGVQGSMLDLLDDYMNAASPGNRQAVREVFRNNTLIR